MWSLIKSNSTTFFKVFHALCTTYQLDNREMIRRAADLLTPAVPMRMEDGYQQIFASVNKVLIEEGHNSFHVHHVLWVCTLTFYQNLIKVSFNFWKLIPNITCFCLNLLFKSDDPPQLPRLLLRSPRPSARAAHYSQQSNQLPQWNEWRVSWPSSNLTKVTKFQNKQPSPGCGLLWNGAQMGLVEENQTGKGWARGHGNW